MNDADDIVWAVEATNDTEDPRFLADVSEDLYKREGTLLTLGQCDGCGLQEYRVTKNARTGSWAAVCTNPECGTHYSIVRERADAVVFP